MAEKEQASKKPTTADPVVKTMKIGDLVQQHPEAVPILFRYGLHCVGCRVAAYETIEQGACAHGMPDDIIDRMVEDVNKAISEGAKNEKEQAAQAEKAPQND